MKTMIKTMIRDKKTKTPRGVAVAVKHDNKVNYGFSLINPELDKWDKRLGTEIAVRRAMADSYQLPAVEDREKAVLDAFERLERIAIKYFKDLDYEDVALAGHLGLEDVNV